MPSSPEQPPWADLPSDLVRLIADRVPLLREYVALRLVCSPWRSAIEAPMLALLLTGDGGEAPRLAAYSLPAGRVLTLSDDVRIRGRCVGCRDGWVGFASETPVCDEARPTTKVVLVNVASGKEVALPPLPGGKGRFHRVRKVVWTPDRFRVVAIGRSTVAYLEANDDSWAVQHVGGAALTDALFDASGMRAWVLASSGDVYFMDVPHAPASLVIKAFSERAGLGSILDDVLVCADKTASTDSAGPATRILVHDERVFQVRSNTRRVVVRPVREVAPAEGATPTLVVLRYRGGLLPPWEHVADLGALSVFLGRNNALSSPSDGAPWLRANSLYWIGIGGGGGGDTDTDMELAVTFDIGTGETSPCAPPLVQLLSTLAWSSVPGGI